MDKNDKIKELTLVALFMALVIIGSKIYIGTHDTFRFHLGNSMCLLSAFVLTPFYAGIASGVGSMIFDILFYPSGLACFITLITKFVMGYVAGICFNYLTKIKFGSLDINNNVVIRTIISGTIGEIAYIILYGLKTFIERRYVMAMPIEAVMPILVAKIGASFINAIVAVLISTILYRVLSSFLKRN